MIATQMNPAPDTAVARLNMVEGQLRPNGIQDERILTAMETLPREIFTPPSMAGICTIDAELPVLPGHNLLRPLVTARLIQYAAINQNDTVLDIAPASGYSTVILASMAQGVFALESDADICSGIRATCESLEINNVTTIAGKYAEGAPTVAPFNAIIINGAVEEIPAMLFDQLAEGGRLVTVLRTYGAGGAAHNGEIRVYQKNNGAISSRSIIDACASLLPAFAKPRVFTFAE